MGRRGDRLPRRAFGAVHLRRERLRLAGGPQRLAAFVCFAWLIEKEVVHQLRGYGDRA